MKTHSAKKELILLPILLIVILLCIAGHFLLQASFQDSNVTEYMLAMFGLVIIAFKIASNSEDKERAEQSDNG